jgi:hypothetical protein
MKPFVVALGALLLLAAPPAAEDQLYWSLNLHLQTPTAYDCSDLDEAAIACDGIVTSQVSGASHHQLWVLVGRVHHQVGIGGVQFGWAYESGLTGHVIGWTTCTGGAEYGSSAPYPVWPTESGSGVAIRWAGDCYDDLLNPDGIVKVGFWNILPGPPACAWIQEEPRAGNCAVAICDQTVFRLLRRCFGTACLDQADCAAHFPGDPECNKCPCEPFDPIETMSWSAIKAMYD